MNRRGHESGVVPGYYFGAGVGAGYAAEVAEVRPYASPFEPAAITKDKYRIYDSFCYSIMTSG